MTECKRKGGKESSQLWLQLAGVKEVCVDFAGGDLTSDAGLLLLRSVDEAMEFTAQVNQWITDPREPGKVAHEQMALLRQRVYQIIAGYEDCNDADALPVGTRP